MGFRPQRARDRPLYRLSSLARFVILYAALYCAFGVVSPFLPAYFGDRGLTSQQIAFVIGLGTAFAAAVRLQNLPGIGWKNVERTFSLEDSDPHYGLAGSIRTDIALQNDQGDVIAIYDVKTGERELSVARANQLRKMTRAAPDTPVFELNIVRGVSRKFRSTHGRYGIHRLVHSSLRSA